MSDLADFLLARIAEEERACQALLYGRASTAEQLMSPGRLLLHCAARRHVIALHEIHVVMAGHDTMIDGESGSSRSVRTERDFICPTLRTLALPYFDHPDYQPHWQVKADFIGPADTPMTMAM
jgi:hypothetical protein